MNLDSMALQPTKMTYFIYFIILVTMCRTHKIWMYKQLFPLCLLGWNYTVEML